LCVKKNKKTIENFDKNNTTNKHSDHFLPTKKILLQKKKNKVNSNINYSLSECMTIEKEKHI